MTDILPTVGAVPINYVEGLTRGLVDLLRSCHESRRTIEHMGHRRARKGADNDTDPTKALSEPSDHLVPSTPYETRPHHDEAPTISLTYRPNNLLLTDF